MLYPVDVSVTPEATGFFDPSVLTIRVDESLYFSNARYLGDSAVNDIDMSALESLEAIDHRLGSMGVTLHLSEVKGPVADKLRRTSSLQRMSGSVFLSQHDAIAALTDRRPPRGVGVG